MFPCSSVPPGMPTMGSTTGDPSEGNTAASASAAAFADPGQAWAAASIAAAGVHTTTAPGMGEIKAMEVEEEEVELLKWMDWGELARGGPLFPGGQQQQLNWEKPAIASGRGVFEGGQEAGEELDCESAAIREAVRTAEHLVQRLVCTAADLEQVKWEEELLSIHG